MPASDTIRASGVSGLVLFHRLDVEFGFEPWASWLLI